MMQAYEDFRAQRSPRALSSVGFRRYVEWAESRDIEAAAAF
jgi:hypothetical protein